MGNGKVLEGLPIAVDYWKLPKMSEKFKVCNIIAYVKGCQFIIFDCASFPDLSLLSHSHAHRPHTRSD